MERVVVDASNLNQAKLLRAASVLAEGGIVAFPTETVYGLAARADHKEAVKKLYSLKNRLLSKPFSVALADPETAIDKYFAVLAPFGHKLVENFWPGPLTIIYYQKDEKKIGLRIPSDLISRGILSQLSFPVFLPSANRRGESEANSAQEVERTFGGEIDLVVDGGQTQRKKPSTVIDLTYKPFKIVREGVVSENEIASIFIKKRILFVCTGNSCRSPMAEYLFRRYLAKEKSFFSQRYEIISAGTSVIEGTGSAWETEEILRREEGLNFLGFRSTQLTKHMIFSSDYIFVMEDSQAKYILNLVPSASARTFNLKKFLPFNLNVSHIPDPIGASFDFYERVYSLIKKAVLELVDWL